MVASRRLGRMRLVVAVALITGVMAAVPALSAGAQEAEPADHLLLTEIVVTPTTGEFVEIHNPTGDAIDLSDVYLSDATFAPGGTFYYNTVTGNGGGGDFGDFNARFPDGASIGAGEYQTVAMTGSDGFNTDYGVDPTYELFEDGAAADGIADLREATPGSISGQGGLSDAGEVVVLFSWDGSSDLVEDLDYVVWGDKNEAVDKTGAAVDGPDADADATMYQDDVAVAVQEGLSAAEPHAAGESSQRRDLTEGDETQTGGNGVTGNDETSENVTTTWGVTAPTPNGATTLDPPDPGGGGGPGPLPELGVCSDPFTPIYDIQGAGADSPLFEQGVVTEGVVTAVFAELGGFAIQDAAGDGDAATSDGIWVNADPVAMAAVALSTSSASTTTSSTTSTTVIPPPTEIPVEVGMQLRIVAHVDEFFGLTQLTALTDDPVLILACGAGDPVTPGSVALPLPPGGDFEPYEGMIVAFDKMTATDVFSLSRFGEAELSAPDRLRIPTDVVLPGAQNAQLQDQNNRSRIVLDDVSTEQNPDPVPYVGGDGTLRLGEMVEDLVALVTCNFGCHKLEPVGAVDFAGNPRPAEPADAGGAAKVASFNVLNFWTSLDDGTNPGARGADSAEELDRQTQKLVAAIEGMDADIIALQELENNGPTAIGALVDALNASAGSTVWAAVADPAYPGGLEATNAIKVGIIYRTDRATAMGGSEISEDPEFALDRPPIAQTFAVGAEVFTVVSNHFKSKSCTNTAPGDPFPEEADAGDGQGCFNLRRTRQAMALIDFVAELQTLSGDPDVLAIGDMNSYAMEDPIRALRDGGLTDTTQSLPTSDRYTFTFFGQAGQLDYAFATPSLATKVTGIDIWHINTDEPPFLDYNTEFKPPSSFSPDQYRSSDHDPLLVGIGDAAPAPPRLALKALSDDLAALATGTSQNDKRLNAASFFLAKASAPGLWVDDDNPADGTRALRFAKKAVNRLSNVTSPPVGDAIGAIVGTARSLADAQIERAKAAGGKPSKIAVAEAKLAAGDSSTGTGAVKEYRAAWKVASAAIEATATFATFNASLNRNNAGELASDLATPSNAQAQTIAEIIQRNRPATVLINEFDFDTGGIAAALFQDNYLGVSQNGADPIVYPYVYVAPSNTGIASGFDLDNSGSVGGPGDAFGFGFFEGQFGMVVYSMHPLRLDEVRTFQNFLWKDMPGALLPDDPATAEPADWYSPEELDIFRLSSKSHWDIPVQVGREVVHFLVSHPTPPVFDGPEDRNGTRNHDEIRFWADYIDPAASGYVYDDDGGTGGLGGDDKFVIAGDQNADPFDGDSTANAAQLLLDSPFINTSVTPSSKGGPQQAALTGGLNDTHVGDPAFDTADFNDAGPGNLRADYVLPFADALIRKAVVFWPKTNDPLFALVGVFPFPSSDHRMVWIRIDVR